MPLSLLSVEIRGIRSYSPEPSKTQNIEFTPLTLIVGPNGSGKTSVIESLKFIISGEEPPLSDSRRNFLHSFPVKLSVGTADASIVLKFLNARDELCIAKRELNWPCKGSKNATPSISSCYRLGNAPWSIVHGQEEWSKRIPKLFRLPNQAILNNVVMCHQDNNLWCLGDSSSVKQVFDQIFGCEKYKKEIKHLDAEIKTCKQDIQLNEKDLKMLKIEKDTIQSLEANLQESRDQIAKIVKQIKDLDEQIEVKSAEKAEISPEIKEFEANATTLRVERSRETRAACDYESLKNELKSEPIDQSVMTDDSLSKEVETIRNTIDKTKAEISRLRDRSKVAKVDLEGDMTKVQVNLNTMGDTVKELDKSPEAERLCKLLDETKSIVDSLVTKIQNGRVTISTTTRNEVNTDDLAEKIQECYEKSTELSANLRLRKSHASLQACRSKIEKLESQVGDEDRLKDLQSKYKVIERAEMELRDKRSTLNGRKMQLEREISRFTREIASHDRINPRYALAMGRLACANIILSDLEKLKQCFQESITTFHDQMIVRINEVLRVKWRQIYTGSDIDTIELVDEEITRGKDKKAYNYYIAMRKNQTRMKMREKSSAGQKALAAIILRMALAELFIRDFSFIAFDEPTANLDTDNVISLAKAIASYVRNRSKKGGNIQWIIITHDECFLRTLDQECSPHFHKIQLDGEGHSMIEKVPYSENFQ